MKFVCAFIYVADKCDPKKQNAFIPGEIIDMYVVGVSDYNQAKIIAKHLVETKKVSAIELCAGFGNEGVNIIKQVVGDKAHVGAVRFDYHPAFDFKSGDKMFKK